MPEIINDHPWLTLLLALIGLLAGVSIVVRIVSNRNRYKNSQNNNSNTVVQQDNIVGGDMSGRDIHK